MRDSGGHAGGPRLPPADRHGRRDRRGAGRAGGVGAAPPELAAAHGHARLHAAPHGLPGFDHDRMEAVRRVPGGHRKEPDPSRLPPHPVRERPRLERAAGRHGRAAADAGAARRDRCDVLVPVDARVGRTAGPHTRLRPARRHGTRLRAGDVAVPRDPSRAGADGKGGAGDPGLGLRHGVDGLERRPAFDQGPVERMDGVRSDRRRHRRHRREGPDLARPGRHGGGVPHRRAGRSQTAAGQRSSSGRRAGAWNPGGNAMSARRMLAAAALAAVLLAAGCGGSSGSSGGSGGVKQGGVFTIGTTNYIDTLNPFNYIEAEAVTAYLEVYPELVQLAPNLTTYEGSYAKSWSHSSDFKTYTYVLNSGGKWSDGKPLSSSDVAWTANTIVKYQSDAAAVLASSVAHVTTVDAPNPTTVVFHYDAPV